MKGNTVSRNGWWYFQLLRYRNRLEVIHLSPFEAPGDASYFYVRNDEKLGQQSGRRTGWGRKEETWEKNILNGNQYQ